MTYRAPLADIGAALKYAAGLPAAIDEGLFGDLTMEDVDAVLTEAGRFAAEVIAPLNRVGDTFGTPFKDGAVTTAPGWKEAYRGWCSGGWNGLAAPAEWGGQALPQTLSMACQEMWNSASMGFAVGPLLTIAAVDALYAHGSETLKQTYLKKLVSGEWTGSMQLTEPQAGSDVGALRTRAERAPDGSYRLKGQKIFITYGEHDLTDNIIHFVLARLPDAPPGTRGISLFLVPKFLLNADGSLGARNDIRAHSVEHKLGIHGSPTCTMMLGDRDGAIGYLIGEENAGMACMFTMMNRARLAVGLQGVGIAECATQQALAYARERKQGRTAGMKATESAPIIAHPDVRRMLLSMRALTGAARAICYATAIALDRSERSKDAAARKAAHERASLLTPTAKAFSSDIGIEVASLGVQVYGGMGFIEETGAAQLYRDARIAAIYEGTNGIHGIDLVTRKLPLSRRRGCRGTHQRPARHRRGGRGEQRPGIRLDRRAARRSGRKSRPRHHMDARPRCRATPTRRSPGQRRICASTALPVAAACWRTRRSPRSGPATTRPHARRWRGFLPKTSPSNPARWSAP